MTARFARHARKTSASRNRAGAGFALPVVLAVVAFLTLIVLHLASSARTEARIAGNLRNAAALRAAADGGIYRAAFAILNQPAHRWAGEVFVPAEDGITVELSWRDERGLIDINIASGEMLRTAFVLAGIDTARAEALAASIAAWRSAPTADRQVLAGLPYAPPNEPFRRVDELRLVPGFDRALLERLSPHLTVYTREVPWADTDDPLAARTLRDMRERTGYEPPPAMLGGPAIVRIVATARGKDNAIFKRSSVLRLDPTAANAPCQILTWD